MIKKKIIKVFITLAIISGIAFLLYSYYFHTSVKIDSEYDIEGIYIVDEDGKQINKYSTRFSHFAMYGQYSYFFVVRDHKVLVSYLKTNAYEHDTIHIEIKSVESPSDSTIQIDVSRNGLLENSEVFNLNEVDGMVIELGP